MIDWIKKTSLTNRKLLGVTAAFIGILALLSCGSGDDNGNEGGTEPPIFPPAVFMADKDVAGTVELYASSDDGSQIIKLSANLVSNGDVVDFKIAPDGMMVAYLADQRTDQVFELYVVPVDKKQRGCT